MESLAQKKWARETPWRQGSLFTEAAIKHFGISPSIDKEDICAVVISHDCDLANDNLEVESCVEFIIGRFVKANGTYKWGKAPRTLHYPILLGKDERYIEIISTQKSTIHKDKLAQFEPDDRYTMDGSSLATLRSWLASRYNRAAFPDAFVTRMQKTKAEEKLSKSMEKGEFISFIYFNLDDGNNVERIDGDPYQLSIVLVFPPGDDPSESAKKAEDLAVEVYDKVSARLNSATDISLMSVFAISEDELPVSQAKLLTRWSLEHMTLRSNTDQPRPPSL